LVFEAIGDDGRKKCRRLAGDPGEELLGIIPSAITPAKFFCAASALEKRGVDEIMSRDVTITSSNEPVEKCMRLMTEKRIRHLPVVDDGTLRGFFLSAIW